MELRITPGTTLDRQPLGAKDKRKRESASNLVGVRYVVYQFHDIYNV